MLQRNRGKIEFCCDACGEVLETDTADFDEAREAMKRDGWYARKQGDEWTHFCRTC